MQCYKKVFYVQASEASPISSGRGDGRDDGGGRGDSRRNT